MRRRAALPWTLLLAALPWALPFAATSCESVPDAPVAIVWDEQACDECHMHLSDRRFAAELATDDGMLFFDDPGCLLHYAAVHRPVVRHAWFRDARRGRWLGRDEVAFVEMDGTPMGYGLAAVRRGTQGAFGWDEAARRVAAGPRGEEHVDARP